MILMSSCSELEREIDRYKSTVFLKKPFSKELLVKSIFNLIETDINLSSFSKSHLPLPRSSKGIHYKIHPDTSHSSNRSIVIRSMRVIIVDDDILSLRLLGRIVSDLGYEADLFTNGTEAYRHLETNLQLNVYDFIITDVDIALENGVNFINTCRRKFTLDIPIIVITSDLTPELHAELKMNGTGFILSKPVSIDQVVGICEKVKYRTGSDLRNASES